ncbi:hypothetical protein ACSMXM_04840 [Pacificimonas sp. ICDLI1SI03]
MLTFAQTDQIIARLNAIKPSSRSAFTNRLKNFQRIGFPKGTNTGRGKAAVYTSVHLLKLAIAVEFLQVGITPSVAAAAVEEGWPSISLSVCMAAEVCRHHPIYVAREDRLFLISQPNSLHDMTLYSRDKDFKSPLILPVSMLDLVEDIDQDRVVSKNAEGDLRLFQFRRRLLIDATDLINEAMYLCDEVFGFSGTGAFIDALHEDVVHHLDTDDAAEWKRLKES